MKIITIINYTLAYLMFNIPTLLILYTVHLDFFSPYENMVLILLAYIITLITTLWCVEKVYLNGIFK